MRHTGERAELTGCVLDGRYRLRAPLGMGATAVVFEGTAVRSDRKVAVKLLKNGYVYHADICRRLRREAEVLRCIVHPGVVSCIDEGTLPDGSPYVVMERVQGESLSQLLARMGSLSVQETLCLTLRVASILHAVHAAGYVHRDVKPEHVLLSADRHGFLRVRLLDFGVCQPLALPGWQRERERGRVYGTPGYASPEQAAGRVELDGRSDLFALGALMFESLTGELPITGRNAAIILRRTIELDAPCVRERVPHIPPEVAALTAELLARPYHRRPPNARAVERRLRVMLPDAGRFQRELAARLVMGGAVAQLTTTVAEPSLVAV